MGKEQRTYQTRYGNVTVDLPEFTAQGVISDSSTDRRSISFPIVTCDSPCNGDKKVTTAIFKTQLGGSIQYPGCRGILYEKQHPSEAICDHFARKTGVQGIRHSGYSRNIIAPVTPYP